MNKTDYEKLSNNYKTVINNCRENIKDARRAKRRCDKAEKIMYSKTIRWNKQQIRESKGMIRILQLRYKNSGQYWLLMIFLCLLIACLIPGAGLAIILAPIWGSCLIGMIILIIFLHIKN